MRPSVAETVSADGTRLHVLTLSPAEPSAAVTVLCHGLATGLDDCGQFPQLVSKLDRRGIGTVRFDARCHGRSGGRWEDLSLSGWEGDVMAAIEVGGKLVPDASVFLVAASFAAIPAIRAAARAERCAGLVLLNPLLDPYATFMDPARPAAAEVLATEGSHGGPSWVRFTVPWSQGTPLSHCLVEELLAEPVVERLQRLSVPVILFQGLRDKFVPAQGSRAAASSSAVDFRAIPLAGHGFRGFRGYVHRAIARWVARQSRAAAS